MQKMTRRSVLLGTTSLLFSSPAFAWGRFFGRGGAAFVSNQVATALSPNSLTISPTQTGPVGTVAALGGVPSSYTYGLSGAPSGVTINSASGVISVATALTANTYSFTVNVTNLAGTVPLSFSLISATAGFITTMVVQNTTSTTQTNVPVTFGLPLAAGVLTSGSILQAIDNATSSSLAIQLDATASDLSGNVRYVAPTVILPTLNPSETRSVTINKISGTPATGTNILASDILATAFDYVFTVQDHNGNTYLSSARTGLAAGTYTSTTTAATLGGHRGGGGLANEFIVWVPLKTGGGTAHPQAYVIFDILAFKAGTGAVGTGNPIIAIRCDRVIGNGLLQTAPATTDDWYGFSDTCGSTTTNNFVKQTPSQTLTVGANGATGTQTLTASSGLFSLTQTLTAVGIGCVISDGTGVGTVTGIATGSGLQTTATIEVYKAFANNGTLSSGNYTVWGANHPYGGRHRQRMWYDGLAQPKYNVNLGTAWNGTTGGPGSYIAGTGLTLNYATSVSTVGNTIAAAPNMAAQGNNPTAFGGGQAGDITMYFPQTGERSEIGLCTAWDINALIRYDADALPVLLFEADKFNLAPFSFRSPTTGLAGRMDTTKDWVLNGGFSGGTLIAMPYNNQAASPWISSDWTVQLAHMGDPYFLPYLLTGDWYWLDSLAMWCQYTWLRGDPGLCGSQLNRVNFDNDCEMRGHAWGMRTLFRLALLTPDANTSALGWSKQHVKDWLSAHWTAPRGGGTYAAGGANVEFVNNTGPGLKYGSNGPRWTAVGAHNNSAVAPWQINYFLEVLMAAKKMGMLNSDGLAFLSFLAAGAISAVNDSGLVPQYAAANYEIQPGTPGSGVYFTTWADVYQRTANSEWASRQLPGPMTVVNASNPAAVQVTVPTGYLNTTSFYLRFNGWVVGFSSSDPNHRAELGAGAITAITLNSPTGYDTLTLDTTGATNGAELGSEEIFAGAFQQSSFAAGCYIVPNPAVGDALGTDVTNPANFPRTSDDYWPLAKSALYLLSQDGSFSGATTAYNTVNSWGTGWGLPDYELKWHVQ